MGVLKRAASALSLISRFPVPLTGAPDYSGLPFWMPMAGFVAGMIAFSGGFAGSLLFHADGARALCALLALFLAFDLFHLDGLADTADAFMGYGTRERRLEILKDPRTGSFGLFAGIAWMGALWYCSTAAASLAEGSLLLLVVPLAAPVAGRSAASLVPVFLKAARPGGLGAMLQPYSRVRAGCGVGLAFAICLGLAFLAGEHSSATLSATATTSVSAVSGSVSAPASTPAEASVRTHPSGIATTIPVASGPLAPVRGPRAALATGAGFIAALVLSLSVILRAYGRGVGGYTGDALGATICLGTLIHLAVSLALIGVL